MPFFGSWMLTLGSWMPTLGSRMPIWELAPSGPRPYCEMVPPSFWKSTDRKSISNGHGDARKVAKAVRSLKSRIGFYPAVNVQHFPGRSRPPRKVPRSVLRKVPISRSPSIARLLHQWFGCSCSCQDDPSGGGQAGLGMGRVAGHYSPSLSLTCQLTYCTCNCLTNTNFQTSQVPISKRTFAVKLWLH